MPVKQGRSSDLLEQLYGDVREFEKILFRPQNTLIRDYPNKNLKEIFSILGKRIISIAPMVFCDSLSKDLGFRVSNNDLTALGLLMLSISTHDDVVDELPQNRVRVAALTCSGNIATNLGFKFLLQTDKKAAEILLSSVNKNHYFQQLNRFLPISLLAEDPFLKPGN